MGNVDCIGCHQLGQESTRTIPAQFGEFKTGAEAWMRRVASGGWPHFLEIAAGKGPVARAAVRSILVTSRARSDPDGREGLRWSPIAQAANSLAL
jgi:hypothetical protein